MKIYHANKCNRDSVIKALSKRKSLKFTVVFLTAWVTTISLIAPGIAQIIRPSQDFFNQGREELEREIQILRESPNTPENPQKTPEPILKVSPSPANEANPLPSATPSPTPEPEVSN